MKLRFEELDAIRGIAAFSVVMMHFILGINAELLVFKLGTTLIDTFFILSGFVIFYSLESISNYKEFIANRLSRLYPTYWACVTLTFLLIIFIALFRRNLSEINIVHYLGNLTMFQYYLRIPDLDGPYWTMIVEMLFYIVMLLLYYFKLLKHLNVIFLSISIFLVLSIYLGLDKIWLTRIFYWMPLFQFLPLFHAGIVYYKIITKQDSPIMNYVVLLLCLLCQIFLYQYSGRTKMFADFTQNAIMLVAYFLLFLLFVKHKLSFLVNKASLFLGKISYALYLTHQKLSIILFVTYAGLFRLPLIIATPLTILTAIAIANYITNKIDIPYSKKMKIYLYKKFDLYKNKEEIQ